MAAATMMRSPALLADAPAAPVAAVERRTSSAVAMRPRRGPHFGEVSEGSFFGQSVKSFLQASGARSAAKRSAGLNVEAAATFETQTKVALVRIGTRGSPLTLAQA